VPGIAVSIFRVLLVCLAGAASAQSAPASLPPADDAVTDMAPVLVSGVQPGPGLWKVSRGDHVMWVLGTVSPLPRHMQWKSDEVEDMVAASQQVLGPPGLVIGARVGFFGKLMLLPSMMGLKKNPDGATLRDVLPPELHERWDAQRRKYLGNSHRFERLRPIFAGKELYDVAMKQIGLTDDGGVRDLVSAMAKRHGVAVRSTSYQLVLEGPRSAAKTFKKTSMEDTRCLSQVIDAMDSDLVEAAERANAWSVGDIDALRSMLAGVRKDACLSAIGGAGFAKKLGMQDVQQRTGDAWLDTARDALENNRQTFAMLPMEQVLSADGYLARLQQDGFVVQAPDEPSSGSTTH